MAVERLSLPATLSLHVVGHCNFGCRFCHARSVKAKQYLRLDEAKAILDALPARSVTRVKFAGGEPTLHPNLLEMLSHATGLGLVTSLVTNASLVDREWCRRHLPWLRWLALSCDSAESDTCDALGRRPERDPVGQPERVRRACAMVHEWNAARPDRDRVRLKLNMVVTSLNADEDPSDWIRACAPDRVKLLQCLVVPGENADAADLVCAPEAFGRFVARVEKLGAPWLRIVAERSDDLPNSYGMVDPHGCFRQSRPGGYIASNPIAEVGLDEAWAQVGGCDLESFAARGDAYDHGEICRGVRTPIIALEGLDGSGKSTLLKALARALGAVVVRSPPESISDERARADRSPPAQRREFYWRGNAEAMRIATDLVFAGEMVLIDRCFASTAAYEAAERGKVATPAGLPRQLPKPDLVVFLAVSEAERSRRLRGRGDAETAEEQRLARDAAFRQRVLEGYRQLGCVFVDAEGELADTLGVVRGLLKHFGDRDEFEPLAE